ncbi:nucleoside hydrolase [Membranicola marinus]|uniref:Nucleoside hydrolase n=1 Tax=Membranihabitans marinus TaxID=1227546 RepID=A0A953HMK6_9BACT|nr:nucleoside hydrolase [Membranihabitans marinus]MBY5958749.1 nucleoside hydrolase [Membranihabitans marinus]
MTKNNLLITTSLAGFFFTLLLVWPASVHTQPANPSPAKTKVWIDADLAVGMKRHHKPGYSDVDDGYAVLQLMKSPVVDIVGISTVFGNTTIDNAFAIGQKMSKEFSRKEVPVYKGAGEPIDLNAVQTNDAAEALHKALQEEKLTILAIGPATNIGLLLLNYPEISDQIEKIVLVAGRRKPTDYFKIGTQGNRAQDLNFDLDNTAFRVLFENKVPIVLCPFEISNKVWLKKNDLDRINNGMPANRWLAEASRPWLKQWLNQGAEGFNPFDVLASHFITAPGDLVFESLNARLEIHPDDTAGESQERTFKQYLICDKGPGYPVLYCYEVTDGYHEKLIRSLLKQ